MMLARIALIVLAVATSIALAERFGVFVPRPNEACFSIGEMPIGGGCRR